MRLRNFIDSYELYLLLEATKYDAMFASIIPFDTQLKGFTNNIITWARENLKREDRIVWFLRWYRLKYLDKLVTNASREQVDRADTTGTTENNAFNQLWKLENKYTKELEKLTGKPVAADHVPGLLSFQDKLLHYLSLPVQAIQNLQFSNQTVSDLFSQMDELEEHWKQENINNEQHLQPQEGDHIVIPFKDGWAWWLLDRMYCSAEGKAMGHCGNAGSPQAGDQILSLRKQTSHGWRPSLTFILREDGMLGEMKGRNNDKPQAAYHPYIVTLLQDDMVKGIVGGGYMPDHNFEMSDLPEQQQNQLYETKPALAPAAYIFKKFGPTPEFVAKILSEFGPSDMEWDDAHKLFVVEKFNNVDDFIAEYGSDSTKYLAAAFRGDNEMFMDADYSISDNDAHDLLNSLPPDLQQGIWVYTQNTYRTSDNEEDIDWDDADELWDMLVENNDEIVQTLKNAEADGHRLGAESEAYKAYAKALQNPFHGTNADYLTVHYTMYTDQDGKEHIQMDGPCSLTITPEVAVTISENEDILDDISNYGWPQENKIEVREPHYGWSGYDQNAAIENASDQLHGMV